MDADARVLIRATHVPVQVVHETVVASHDDVAPLLPFVLLLLLLLLLMMMLPPRMKMGTRMPPAMAAVASVDSADAAGSVAFGNGNIIPLWCDVHERRGYR